MDTVITDTTQTHKRHEGALDAAKTSTPHHDSINLLGLGKLNERLSDT